MADEVAQTAQGTTERGRSGREAACAGGGDGTGDGFAVVADEIKGLAEETRESAEEGSKRINAIQAESCGTVADIQAMDEQVSDSVDTIGSTLADFEDIVVVVNDVNATVQEISNATDEQAQTTQDVVGMVDDVASISEETTAEAESVAAAEEQTATTSEVTTNIDSLSEGADDLETRLDEFEVGEQSERVTTTAADAPAQIAQPQD